MAEQNNLTLTGLQALPFNEVPAQLYLEIKDPTSANYNTRPYKNFQIGTFWLNTNNQNLWYLADILNSPKKEGNWIQLSSGAGDLITLTGNTGGAVGPTGSNINVIGDLVGINIVGTPGISTLTVSLVGGGIAAQSFLTDDTLISTPSAGGQLRVGGLGNIITSSPGSAHTLDVSLTGLTQHFVLVGGVSGTSITPVTPTANTGWVLTSNGLGSDPSFQVNAAAGDVSTLTGNSGGAVGPTAGNINVIGDGTSITVVGNPGTSTLTISTVAGAIGAHTFHTDSGDAVEVGGAITIHGGNNISTSGAGSTVTVNVSGTTNHTLQVGNATGSLTSLAAATNGQLPIGSTGANPVIATLTAGTNISITNGAGSITIASGILPSSFSAYLGTSATNQTGNNATVTVPFDTIVFDTHSDYNTGTNLFTAPQAGVYQFNTTVVVSNLSSAMTSGFWSFVIAGTGVSVGAWGLVRANPFVEMDSVSGFWRYNGGLCTYMNSGDTIKVSLLVQGGAGNTATILGGAGGSGGPNGCWFSGCRIG